MFKKRKKIAYDVPLGKIKSAIQRNTPKIKMISNNINDININEA